MSLLKDAFIFVAGKIIKWMRDINGLYFEKKEINTIGNLTDREFDID